MNHHRTCRACGAAAVATVSIVIPLRGDQSGKGLRFDSEWPLCAKHRDVIRFDDVVNAATWQYLVTYCGSHSMYAPEKSAARLEFTEIPPLIVGPYS